MALPMRSQVAGLRPFSAAGEKNRAAGNIFVRAPPLLFDRSFLLLFELMVRSQAYLTKSTNPFAINLSIYRDLS